MPAIYDVPYMQRTRDYYRAQGYTTDYQWAHFTSTPFQRPHTPLRRAKVTVICTAMPDTDEGRARRELYINPCQPIPGAMYTADLSWDKQATHTRDIGSFLPLAVLQKFASTGVIGALTPHFYSVPTEYSQRRTLEQDAPRLLELCREAQTDIALLVPL